MGYFLILENMEGSFGKDIKRGLLIKKEGKEGPKGNFALPLPPADRKTGEGAAHGGGPGRRPWGGGKGGEGLGEPVPHLDLGRGAARRPVHGSGRRWPRRL